MEGWISLGSAAVPCLMACDTYVCSKHELGCKATPRQSFSASTVVSSESDCATVMSSPTHSTHSHTRSSSSSSSPPSTSSSGFTSDDPEHDESVTTVDEQPLLDPELYKKYGEVELNNGMRMPSIALGTWLAEGAECSFAVAYAIKIAGYRHIDAAWHYGNETDIAKGIEAAGVPRSELFLTSKLWSTHHDRVEEALDETLRNLGTDYLDLYLINWPVALNPNGNHPIFPLLRSGRRDVSYTSDIRETWKAMEAMVRKGKARAIGVSNFSKPNLEKVLSVATIVPAVNQTEIHLFNPEHKLVEFMREKGIVPQAHTPLGASRSPLFNHPAVLNLSKKYSALPSEIVLGYLLAKGIPVAPKSANPERIDSNYVGAFAAAPNLDKDDLEELDAVASVGWQRRFFTPPWPVELGFENWPEMQLSCKLPKRQAGGAVKISQCPCAFPS